MENFEENSKGYFDPSGEHLTDEAISGIISQTELFNDADLEQIESHLYFCSECYSKYELLFDSNIEQSDNKFMFPLSFKENELLESDEALFVNEEDTVSLLIKKEEDLKYSFLITVIPPAVLGQNFRITISELDAVIRIPAVKKNKVYHFTSVMSIEVNKISSMFIEGALTKTFIKPEIIKRERKIPTAWYLGGIGILALVIISIILMRSTSDDLDQTPVTGTEIIEPETAINTQTDVKQEELSPEDSALINKLAAEDVQVATVFSNNSVLEEMAEELGENIVLISPAYGEAITVPVTFKWRSVKGNQFRLAIVNNKNKSMYDRTIIGTEITYSGTLQPALYYWKIEVGSSVEAVGKFVIR
jgi:hypothetical protein